MKMMSRTNKAVVPLYLLLVCSNLMWTVVLWRFYWNEPINVHLLGESELYTTDYSDHRARAMNTDFNVGSKESNAQIVEHMITWSISPYSICYIFNQQTAITQPNRIGIVTVSDFSSFQQSQHNYPRSWPTLARMNRLQYAKSFGYDYCEFPRDWDFATFRDSRWSKYGALSTMLTYYKFVVWIDTDTLFWDNPPVPVQRAIDEWFGNYTELSVLFPDHGKQHRNLNSGVIILKRSEFTFDFLVRVYREYSNRSDITAVHGDQDAFQHFVDHNEVGNEIKIIPTGNLQTIYKMISGRCGNHSDRSLEYRSWQKCEKRWNSILLHRVGTPSVKYFQLRDVAISWMDPELYERIKGKCPECLQDDDKTDAQHLYANEG